MSSNAPAGLPDAGNSRTRSFDDSPALAAQAAEMLRSPRTMLPLGVDEVQHIVRQMRLVSAPRGTLLFREGDESRSNHMLLLLEGEVSVESAAAPGTQAVAISVLGPGSIIGEMAMIDGAPRSANCSAMSNVLAAGLSRQGLERLLQDHPLAAAKLLLVLSQFTAERLRALSQQLQIYAQLNDELRAAQAAGRSA
jgi:CRP/FNR family transcriptional regulator, cyclic AMP receptor protein